MGDGFDVADGEEARESELPALRQMESMGYTYRSRREINAERDSTNDVILRGRLAEAIKRINPGLAQNEVDEAIRQLEEVRHGDSLVDINERVHARLVGLSQSGGLMPITVAREGKDGTKFTRVRVIDFEDIGNNDFVVTNQFAVSGHRDTIVPDIVAFVNGIPLVVIECKAPSAPSSSSPIEEAYFKNLRRYQREGSGHERLFHYNHVIGAICGHGAKVGTVGSGISRYVPWSGEYPHARKDLWRHNGETRRQEVLLGSVMSREVLLGTLRDFVLYDISSGKKAKLLARQPQYSAVTKAIQRIRSGSSDRGGVIWHTQGSGKSLSMLWLALLARREFENPPIVVVTDRRQLDRQITSVFKRHGFANTHRARSRDDLARLLKNPRAKTILAVIDKFDGDGECTRERAICLVDEAHRSQFGIKAAQMRSAIPNGVFFAFTGTPIDKKDKSTYREFGELLDKYGFEESQADGTTLPILYDGRIARLSVADDSEDIDDMFERILGHLGEETKRRIRHRYANRAAIIESSRRITRIAWDIVAHYRAHVEPNGFKAMLVTSSKTAAVRYKSALDPIFGPSASKIIMTESDEGDAAEEHAAYRMTQEERESAAEKFKLESDPTKILIVVDMLLVGYNAPICQVMYLDKGLREHNLLQAIARVNRTYGDTKTHGLIVDYYGVTRELHKALASFDKSDITGALCPMERVYGELREAHREAAGHLDGVDRNSDGEILRHFASEGKRAMFRHAFRRFERLLNTALPAPQARKYVDDLHFMARVLRLFAAYYGTREDIREYGPKVRELVDRHIEARGVELLARGVPVRPEEFLGAIAAFSRSARAALLISRIRAVIAGIRCAEPEYAETLRERLEGIIKKERERRAESLDELSELFRDCVERDSQIRRVFGEYRATPLEFTLYHALEKAVGDEAAVRLAKEVFGRIAAQTQIIDWSEKVTVEKRIQQEIYEALRGEGLGDEAIELSERTLERVRSHPDGAARAGAGAPQSP